MPGAANLVALLIAALGLLAGVGGFVLFYLARQGGKRKKPRQLPRQWPLSPRQLANSAERQIWHWLQQVFPEHQVMIKLPITRFTAPNKASEAGDWFTLLGSAYCTFTLCDMQGLVIGCVDLLGPRGQPQSSRQIKETLLAQCGIGYRTMSAQELPSVSALRADFLGGHNADSDESELEQRPHTAPQTLFEEVTLQVHETLERHRRDRQSGFAPLGGANDSVFVPLESQHAQTYQPQTYRPQPDSFLASLDSRRALLGGR